VSYSIWVEALGNGDINYVKFCVDNLAKSTTKNYTLVQKLVRAREKPLPLGVSYEVLPDNILDLIHSKT
jgi:hypothetical protein